MPEHSSSQQFVYTETTINESYHESTVIPATAVPPVQRSETQDVENGQRVVRQETEVVGNVQGVGRQETAEEENGQRVAQQETAEVAKLDLAKDSSPDQGASAEDLPREYLDDSFYSPCRKCRDDGYADNCELGFNEQSCSRCELLRQVCSLATLNGVPGDPSPPRPENLMRRRIPSNTRPAGLRWPRGEVVKVSSPDELDLDAFYLISRPGRNHFLAVTDSGTVGLQIDDHISPLAERQMFYFEKAGYDRYFIRVLSKGRPSRAALQYNNAPPSIFARIARKSLHGPEPFIASESSDTAIWNLTSIKGGCFRIGNVAEDKYLRAGNNFVRENNTTPVYVEDDIPVMSQGSYSYDWEIRKVPPLPHVPAAVVRDWK